MLNVPNVKGALEITNVYELVFLEVYADDCHACERQKEVFKRIEDSDLYDDIIFLAINLDDDLEGLAKYSIYSTPTTLVFQHGWVVETLVGLHRPRQIEDIISRYRVL